MRRASVITFAVAGIGMALIGVSAIRHPVPMLVWNASASVPVGLYRAAPGIPDRGDFALVRTPDSVAVLASERGYLPVGVPLIKHIAAVAGDEVCASDLAIFVNGRASAHQLKTDHLGRLLFHWHGCRRLTVGEIFLLADAPDSFDSRYFGPVSRSSIIERLVPLWTE
jgi:conjugative transfer signal peptidase TraF